MKRVFNYMYNIPVLLSNEMFGSNHKPVHRITIGVLIGMVGVLIVSIGTKTPGIFIHYTCDAFGMTLHGIGITPIIEHISRKVTKE